MKFRLLRLFASLALLGGNAVAQTPAAAPAAQQPQAAPKPAQDPVAMAPAAKPEDVKSVDSIVNALYNVISGPAGERDWNRFRSLFLPGATLTSTRKDDKGVIHVNPGSVEDYVRRAGGFFLKEGFFESPLVSRVQSYGNITHVFCSYESRHTAGEAPFARGINSIQLANDGNRWWIMSILWDSERPDNPLPKDMATKP
jgi:hypothetical protein